jgi:hypothetical protein
MNIEPTDEEVALLIRELTDIAFARYQLSPRINTLKAVLAKPRPTPVPEPSPPASRLAASLRDAGVHAPAS